MNFKSRFQTSLTPVKKAISSYTWYFVKGLRVGAGVQGEGVEALVVEGEAVIQGVAEGKKVKIFLLSLNFLIRVQTPNAF